MAFPAAVPPFHVARQTPAGIHLADGFTTLLSFELDQEIALFEKSLTPPSIDGRDPIDQTTFWNFQVVTKWPRYLYEWTDVELTCAYDPAVYDNIIRIVNVNQVCNVIFPDNVEIRFWGYLRMFKPNENVEGTMPDANVTVVITNLDNCKVESRPTLYVPDSTCRRAVYAASAHHTQLGTGSIAS